MAIRAASVGAFFATLLAHGPVQAGCGNVCVMSEPRVRVEPEFKCVWTEAISNDCGCRVALVVHNDCAVPLEASNFKFDSCWSIGDPGSLHCPSLAPKSQGHFEIWLNATGPNERAFTLRQAEQDHALSVEVDVSSIDDGDMCGVGRRPGRQGAPALITLTWAGLIALAARRRLRAGTMS
jgi:hypothetical protein